jgi:hypothetical protein
VQSLYKRLELVLGRELEAKPEAATVQLYKRLVSPSL